MEKYFFGLSHFSDETTDEWKQPSNALLSLQNKCGLSVNECDCDVCASTIREISRGRTQMTHGSKLISLPRHWSSKKKARE